MTDTNGKNGQSVQALAERIADYVETAKSYPEWSKRDAVMEGVRLACEDARADTLDVISGAAERLATSTTSPLDALTEAGYRIVEVPGTWPHRCVGGNEANQLDLIHGCCAACLVPWPCPSQEALDEAVLSSVGADIARWHHRMTLLGWGGHTDGNGRPGGAS